MRCGDGVVYMWSWCGVVAHLLEVMMLRLLMVHAWWCMYGVGYRGVEGAAFADDAGIPRSLLFSRK